MHVIYLSKEDKARMAVLVSVEVLQKLTGATVAKELSEGHTCISRDFLDEEEETPDVTW